MGLALLKEKELHGALRKDFEEALLQLGNIARITEQRLTLKADQWVDDRYKTQKREIDKLSMLLESYKK